MFFITGDTHGDIDIQKLSSKNFPKGKTITKNDYVIICGDFGLVWDGSNSDKYWQKWLRNKPWTTLFIDGNHENFNLLFDLPETNMFNNTVKIVNESIFYLPRGRVFTIEGKTFFTMGGARSHDQGYRIENLSW